MKLASDRSLSLIAEWQYGVFTRAQAIACGHTDASIKYRLRLGIWRSLYQGVYALSGAPRTWHQSQAAACLWAPDALTAGRAAGFLYGMPNCEPPPVEIMTNKRRRNPPASALVHHTVWLPNEQAAIVQGLPVTSVERTLMSLSNAFGRREAAIAVDQALTRGLTTLALIDRHLYFTARRGRDGCRKLRDITKERLQLDGYPNSPLETLVFEMIVTEGLPLPKPQMEIFDTRGRFVARPDFVYPDEQIVVEGHSRLWHDGVEISKNDRRKQRLLEALGYRIVYATWVDVTRNRRATAHLIRRMLDDRTIGAVQGSRSSRVSGNLG